MELNRSIGIVKEKEPNHGAVRNGQELHDVAIIAPTRGGPGLPLPVADTAVVALL